MGVKIEAESFSIPKDTKGVPGVQRLIPWVQEYIYTDQEYTDQSTNV